MSPKFKYLGLRGLESRDYSAEMYDPVLFNNDPALGIHSCDDCHGVTTFKWHSEQTSEH
jgi:hypothetical protein